MSRIIELAQDLERLVFVFTNIVLAIYGVYSTIKVKRWQRTADFIGHQLRLEEMKSITEPRAPPFLARIDPPNDRFPEERNLRAVFGSVVPECTGKKKNGSSFQPAIK